MGNPDNWSPWESLVTLWHVMGRPACLRPAQGAWLKIMEFKMPTLQHRCMHSWRDRYKEREREKDREKHREKERGERERERVRERERGRMSERAFKAFKDRAEI